MWCELSPIRMIVQKLFCEIIKGSVGHLRRGTVPLLRLQNKIHIAPVTFRSYTEVAPVYSKALEYGDKTAVIDSQGQYSYSQLYRYCILSSRSFQQNFMFQIQCRPELQSPDPCETRWQSGSVDTKQCPVCQSSVGSMDVSSCLCSTLQVTPCLLAHLLSRGRYLNWVITAFML